MIENDLWHNGVNYDFTLSGRDGCAVAVTSEEKSWLGKWSNEKGAHDFTPALDPEVVRVITVTVRDEHAFEVKAWEDATPKQMALALFLECSPSEVEESRHNDCAFETQGADYLVLTDEEADEQAKERAKDTLWAFNVDFLSGYVPALRNARAAKAWTKVAEELCEDADPLVEALLGDRLDDFLNAAIGADGRGHFLNGYDGEEDEQKVGDTTFYIYRC